MSFIKYRVKEVAADFGITPKEVSEIIGKFMDKPKSYTQVLNDSELNVVFDYMTQKNQIKSLEQVFAVQPKPKAEEPKEEAPKAEKPAKAPKEPKAPKAPKAKKPRAPRKPKVEVVVETEEKPKAKVRSRVGSMFEQLSFGDVD